jgi:hypothetical protein
MRLLLIYWALFITSSSAQENIVGIYQFQKEDRIETLELLDNYRFSLVITGDNIPKLEREGRWEVKGDKLITNYIYEKKKYISQVNLKQVDNQKDNIVFAVSDENGQPYRGLRIRYHYDETTFSTKKTNRKGIAKFDRIRMNSDSKTKQFFTITIPMKRGLFVEYRKQFSHNEINHISFQYDEKPITESQLGRAEYFIDDDKLTFDFNVSTLFKREYQKISN